MSMPRTTRPPGIPELTPGQILSYSPDAPSKESIFFPAMVENVYVHGNPSLRAYIGNGPPRLVTGARWIGEQGLKASQCGSGVWKLLEADLRRQEWQADVTKRIAQLEEQLESLISVASKPASKKA